MLKWITRGWRRRPIAVTRQVPLTRIPMHVFERTANALPAKATVGSAEARVIVVPGVGVLRLHFERAIAESAQLAYWKFVRADLLADNAETPAWDEVLDHARTS